jgi:hypothetical protein
MLADDELQQMYEVAFFLSADPAVALTVTLEAADRLTLLRRLWEPSTRPAWPRLPEAWLPQYCVYLVSDAHERAHERPRPGRTAREWPSRDDYLVRYVKCLVWWTLDRPACHIAVALGCFLYRYPPGVLVRLAPAFCQLDQTLRIRARLAQQLQARFPRAHVFPGNHATRRICFPSAHDRQLVQRALALFTPWGTAHVPPPALAQSLLETHFGRVSACSDWDRIHALMNPVDAGLPRLIREYNEALPAGSARRFAEPDALLAIPRFAP